MKSIIKTGLLVAILGLFTLDQAVAQNRGEGVRASPNAAVSQAIGETSVDVTFGRPGLKGRDVNALVNDDPNGKVWRTGANEPTTITFSNDVMFAGQHVNAGTYALFTIPSEDWTIILSKTVPRWGTQYDESQDLLRVKAPVTTDKAPSMEWFSIYFDNLSDTGAHLNLHWGTLKASVPISTM